MPASSLGRVRAVDDPGMLVGNILRPRLADRRPGGTAIRLPTEPSGHWHDVGGPTPGMIEHAIISVPVQIKMMPPMPRPASRPRSAAVSSSNWRVALCLLD